MHAALWTRPEPSEASEPPEPLAAILTQIPHPRSQALGSLPSRPLVGLLICGDASSGKTSCARRLAEAYVAQGQAQPSAAATVPVPQPRRCAACLVGRRMSNSSRAGGSMGQNPE